MTEHPSTFTGVGGEQDWDQSYAGAGVADGAAQIVKSIQDGDWLSAGASVATASIDVLGFIDNPVKAVGTTVVGWLIEHISFLDWYLDHTVGDQGVQHWHEHLPARRQHVGTGVRVTGRTTWRRVEDVEPPMSRPRSCHEHGWHARLHVPGPHA